MTTPIKIDFVSDVMCPWCAVGLYGLLAAIETFGDRIEVEFNFQPFELAPNMTQDGELTIPHLSAKYGISETQVRQSQQQITGRGAELGFEFNFREDSRKWNTFNCHKVLGWVGTQNKDAQLELKKALLKVNFTENQNPSDSDLLCSLSSDLGLDPKKAKEILDSQSEANKVREAERLWQERGVQSVPTVVFDNRYAITGAQPIETFVAALKAIIDKEQPN